MSKELKKELDGMEQQVKTTVQVSGADTRLILTNIYLIRAINTLERTSTRLAWINIAVGLLVLLATVCAVLGITWHLFN